MSTRKRFLLLAAALSIGAVAVPAAAQPVRGHARTCAATFDHAQRTDMESFRDFKWETWLAGHDQDAVSIIADGRTQVGIEAIRASSAARFNAKNSVWSWTELRRRVNGCHSGYITYNTKYALPHLDYWFTAVTTVSYEYKAGRWLTVLDQNTLLEEHVGNA